MGVFQLLGNLIWVICGGIEVVTVYFVAGILMCCTIVGIPFGLKLFEIGLYSFFPFGARSVTNVPFNAFLSLIFNILWIPFAIVISLFHIFFGVLLCITIIGIPFGIQHFKLMGYALMPFGRHMEY